MSTFVVQAEVVKRLSKVCNFFDSSTSHELKFLINTVRIENRQGQSYAVATNGKVASIQYIGTTEHEDGSCHLKLTEEFIKQLEFESMISGTLTIQTIPECAASSVTSTSGYIFQDCSYWFDSTPLNEWRSWLQNDAVEHKGFMYWDVFHIKSLLETSPSGKVCFPEIIDATRPILIRDKLDRNWAGVFLPQPNVTDKVAAAAVKPEWWTA